MLSNSRGAVLCCAWRRCVVVYGSGAARNENRDERLRMTEEVLMGMTVEEVR